jgi:hypothetical protein
MQGGCASRAAAMIRKPLTVREQGQRWLRASLYVLKRRAKARTNDIRILCPVINDATTNGDPLRSGMTAQATAQAHWSRAYRQRRKAGKIVVELEVDEARIAAALIEARLLSPLQADDRAELERCAGSV